MQEIAGEEFGKRKFEPPNTAGSKDLVEKFSDLNDPWAAQMTTKFVRSDLKSFDLISNVFNGFQAYFKSFRVTLRPSEVIQCDVACFWVVPGSSEVMWNDFEAIGGHFKATLMPIYIIHL